MEEKEKNKGTEEKTEKGKRKPVLPAVLVLAVLCVCGWFYYRNTPLQRQLRILEQADSLMEAQEYEKAAEEYAGALEIEAPGTEGEEAAARARQGRLQAVSLQADSCAALSELADRAKACALYGQVIALCDETGEPGETAAMRQEAAEKLTRLQEEMASSFDAVACTTTRDDRSGTTVLPEGTEVPYVWYYDLVQVTEEYYPYADRINEVLLQDGNAFFAGGMEPSESIRTFRDMTPLADAVRPVIDGRTSAEAESAEEDPADPDTSEDPADPDTDTGEASEEESAEDSEDEGERPDEEGSAEESAQAESRDEYAQTGRSSEAAEEAATGSAASSGGNSGTGSMTEEYRNYVGEAGIYSGNGFLSIRLAEVRTRGKTRSVFFRGRTFRLSDGGEVTLGELTQRTDTGLRRLVRRRTASFLDEQGYRNISRADIEDYVTNTDPEDFKFCIREDGELCLVIDQDVSFFRQADHVLEIPLENE